MSPKWMGDVRATRVQLAFWGALVALTGVVLWAGRARAHWPWFSLLLLAVLLAFAVLSLRRVRRALGISWFGVTLVTLTGVCLVNAFLFYVESHRQRSERLEVRGVYHAPASDGLAVGVGVPGLDVVLEGDPLRFERWALRVSTGPGDSFEVESATGVELLRIRRGDAWGFPASGRTVSVLGRDLTPRSPVVLRAGSDSTSLRLVGGSSRGVLAWGEARADLSLTDPLLDRMLGRQLRRGMRVAELPWDFVPDAALADDLVLTQVRPGRRLGRLTLSLPTYRVVSRSAPHLDANRARVLPGDTLRVTSRGSTWAFALDRVPELSRLAAPTAVLFVRQPRPVGWALPSAEACGDDADRCGVISSQPLPPPQPHFDLSGFGLNEDRYTLLARLETASDQVTVTTVDDRVSFAYGDVEPVAAVPIDPDGADAGYLVRVHRSDTSSQTAVLLTVFGLYTMFVSALLVLLGSPMLARNLRSESAHTSAAWALLNMFVIFLGVRLVLGLRVTYAAPFYDRAAATAVGLWITFAAMLVLLGRWASWTPLAWRVARSIGRTAAGVLGLRQAPPLLPGSVTESSPDRAVQRGRLLATVGTVGFLLSVGGLTWQRPAAGLGLVVAAIGVGAWLILGLFGASAGGSQRRPVDVLTTDFVSSHPSRAFLVAAGVAMVLALAIQAPIVALGPVCAGLVLFGLGALLERRKVLGSSARRAWGLYGVAMAAVAAGLWVFVGLGPLSLAAWAVAASGGALVLKRRPEGGRPRVLVAYEGLLAAGRSVFSGVAWIGMLGSLGVLAFLNFQEIPPFIRFALVFMLFLLAVRAGLVCRRVLDDSAPGASITALGLLVIPVGVLLVFMLFDFGLGLVFFLPMMVTVLLAAGIDRLPRTLAVGSAALLLLVTVGAWSVLNPSLRELRNAETAAAFSEEFAGLGNPLVDGLRAVGLSTPITRATVRSVAASDPRLIEEALAYGGPSEALLAAAPSLEQVWGGRAYAASGWTGTGLAGTTAFGRGVPTVVSYAENAFSVYVVSEHGVLGGMVILLLYFALLLVAGGWLWQVRGHVHDSPAGLAVLALTVGSVLWLVLPAAYVAASNLGLLPLTGQNMPFLGLNSWADVVLVSGIGTGVFVALAGLNGTPVDDQDPYRRVSA